MADAELRLRLVDEHFDSGAAADFRLERPLQLVEYVQVFAAIDAVGLVHRQRLEIVVSEIGKFHNKIPETLFITLVFKVLDVCAAFGVIPYLVSCFVVG